MDLPATVRVKISSESAGFISITPVVVQEFVMRDLMDSILGVTGKDPARIRELLRRGSMVSGASRFRWQGWEAEPAQLDELLRTFPDPDPSRQFDRACCQEVVLRARAAQLAISREAAGKLRFLKRRSFWDSLMELASGAQLTYLEYSYRKRADLYRMTVPPAMASQIRSQAELLKYPTLADQVRGAAFDSAELVTQRE